MYKLTQNSATRSKSAGNGAFLFAERNLDMDGIVHILSSASHAQQHAVNLAQKQNNENYSLFLSVYFLAVLDSSVTISVLRRQTFLSFPFLPAFYVSIQENKIMFTLRSKSKQQILQTELKSPS